ncbi:MAG TPA: hypothetical protein ACFCUD_02240 [Cyclobacteriaceae bacterium]
MKERWLEALNEEVRELRALTLEGCEMAVAIEETAKAAKAETRAATQQAKDSGSCGKNISNDRTNPRRKDY